MAGTATSWKTTNIAQNAGQLWAELAVPGASARLTLDADGTPDATANPSAKHLGATRSGVKVLAKSTLIEFFADEFQAPIRKNIDTVSMGITGELLGVTDSILVAFLLPGVGTYATASGYKQVTVGRKALAYSSIAHIYPLVEDSTKLGLFHIYNAINDAGVEWAVARKELGATPFSFVGTEITSRAATDTLGNIWNQIA